MVAISASQRKKKLFSARLNQTLDVLEYPPLHLGRIQRLKDVFQVSQTAARKWIIGLSIPHYERRKLIAQQLGICFEWLEQGQGQMFDEAPVAPASSYPLVTLKQLKKYPEQPLKAKEKIHCPTKTWRPHAFVCVQSWSEMSMRFPLGCFLLIDPEEKTLDQSFILVRLAKERAVVLRHIQITRQGKFLCALDGTPPLLLALKDIILGRVVQVIINI